MRSPVLPASADPSTVRIWNERAVLATLTDGLPRRAAHIAEATGLTPASVRAVLGTLTAKGWMCGLEPEQAGAMGRPARTFQRAHPDGLILGVDLGGHAVRVVVSDLFGEPQVVGEAPVASPDPFALRAALADALSPVDHSRVWMTGLAISGALDAEGRLARSLALPQLVGSLPADALADVLPYSLTRTWHTQLAVLWIATAWLGMGLYIAPAISGHEPKFQRLGVNFLWVCLLIIVVGSFTGQWLAVDGGVSVVTGG